MMNKLKQALRWSRKLDRLDGAQPTQDAETDFEPNRAARRAYYRAALPRSQRMYLAGFGRWRRHRYLTRGN